MQFAFDSWMIKLIYDWQTLIAGLFAFGGAWWTVSGIRAQIKQIQDITKEARYREEFSARAVLPLALSELTNYALKCIRLIHLNAVGPVVAGQQVSLLEREVVGVFQECARCADDKVATKIWILLSKLQVQQSRLRSLLLRRGGEPLSEYDIVQNTLDAADIYAKTAELYEYARDEAGMRKRASTRALASALHAADIWDAEEHPAMRELLERGEDESNASHSD
jgi:hypothetical protein